MEYSENNNTGESRVKKFFKSIRDAVCFARQNKDKQPKVGGNYNTNDYYVSYILNSNNDE